METPAANKERVYSRWGIRTVRTAAILLAAMVLQGSALPAPAGRLSASKISVHFIGRYTDGGKAIVAAGPRVIKILDIHQDMLLAIRDYKKQYRLGKVVLRVYTPKRYSIQDDPEKSAQDFWESVLWARLSQLSKEDRGLIDYLEGPNECDSTPTWENKESIQWFARFWVELIKHMRKEKFKPCVGSIPVGNPSGSQQEIEDKIIAFAPALKAALGARGSWSYHGYSLEYTTDLTTERSTSLRHRRFYDVFEKHAKQLLRLPMILTEGGIDRWGNADKDGWQARGTPEQFLQWLQWYDAELRKDPYVIGVTLFQIGDPYGWKSFNCEPVAPHIAEHLRKTRK